MSQSRRWDRFFGRRFLKSAKCRLRVETIEERLAPAVFNIAVGDIVALSAAITTSNTNNEADVINLAPGTYNFSVVADLADGGNGLPSIDSDNDNTANSLTINGSGAVFQRSGARSFDFYA